MSIVAAGVMSIVAHHQLLSRVTPKYFGEKPQGLQDTHSTETPGYDSTDAEQDMDASALTCTG